eukprot:TRINITY_DN1305_c1_g2_i1.p1 TRINITY_DN1305_c1_g2~~TRINITY_DN1305_c1_g2_i1.p1  ORF type:complete len:257 (+),score=51.90 TRINITY_DN1305_c1_g2_i1:97-771(+)
MNTNIERVMYLALGSAALVCCIQKRLDRRRQMTSNAHWDSEVWETVPTRSRRGKMVVPKKENWKEWVILIDLDCCAIEGKSPLDFQIDSSQINLLRNVSSHCGSSLYFLKQVQTDEEEAVVTNAIAALTLKNFPSHNLLFCSTEIGRKAVGRQLSPALCLESNLNVIEYLSPHISHSCYVSTTPQDDPPSVYQADSLSQYFDILDGIQPPHSMEIHTSKSPSGE